MTKKFIKEAIKHPGALRKELHVKKGEKIPESKLKKAEKKGGIEGKRAHLAETLKHMHNEKNEKKESKKHEKKEIKKEERMEHKKSHKKKY